MGETLEIVFAPYGTDASGQAYPPHPSQTLVSQWVREVRAGQHQEHGVPTLYLQHGVNAGGTRACLAPVIEYALEQPGLPVLIGRREFTDLRHSAMKTFFAIVDAQLIVDRDEQLHIYKLYAQGTSAKPSEIHFHHLSEPDSLGSQEFAAIIVIEASEITEAAFRALQRRARCGALPSFLLLEGNAPTELHWLSELTNPKSDKYDPSITKLEMSSEENFAFMTPAYRTSLESMPPALQRRYVLGKAGFLVSGRPVYPSFIESVHVRPTAIIPDRPLIRGWDFGWRRAGCLWAQRSDRGQLLVHREWMPIETPEGEFIEGVKQRTNEWFGNRACVDYGDPAARNRDPQGISTLRRLREAGIELVYRDTTYAQRIPLINDRLTRNLQSGEPSIIVDPRCRVLIEGLMGGYHYPEIDENHRMPERAEIPEHDPWFSHLANAFEYIMVNLFLGSTPAGQQRRIESSRRLRQRLESVETTAVF